MFLKIFFCVLPVLLPLINGNLLPFPKEIVKCHSSDGECIKDRFNTILHKYGKSGYPELGLSSIEPYILPDIIYGHQSKNSFGISFNMTDVKVYNLSTSNIQNATGFTDELDETDVFFSFLTPKVTIKCMCKMAGKILAIPINAEGPMQIELTNSSLALRIKLGLKMVDGAKVAFVSKHKYLEHIDKFKIKFDMSENFNGDKVISENINSILNDNWEELWKETSKITYGPVVDVMVASFNDIFQKFPYEILFLKDK